MSTPITALDGMERIGMQAKVGSEQAMSSAYDKDALTPQHVGQVDGCQDRDRDDR